MLALSFAKLWDFLTNEPFLNNTVLQWAGLLGVILLGLVLGKVISFLLNRQAGKLDAVEGRWMLSSTICKSMAGPVTLLCLAIALYAASTFMTLQWTNVQGEGLAKTVEQVDYQPEWLKVSQTLAVLALSWFIFRLVDVVEVLLTKWTSRTETTLDDQLVPLLRKALRIFVVIVALLFIAQNVFNWNIGALVAGLGIGGLAFALAAKDMLANLFGSIMIFADRPFQMGDRVIIQGQDGVIEEVGFRSTKIRLLTGPLVTIPNNTVANEVIENVNKRSSIRRILNVTVTYDTPPEKLKRGITILEEMLAARSEHFPEDFPPRVYFSDFNAASLNIFVIYWFAPPSYWDYMQFCHEFNLELLERFNDEGIEFAFPTQTLYLKQDSDFQGTVKLEEGNLRNLLDSRPPPGK